ncbi:glycosyltransferase family A protein [Parasphingorhabdus marina]|uniref:glycosyltransferase family A protein n=1 Tax=Parasphingorhabdus marina TaxID=394732 RepID=UPI000AAECAAF|nr:glycosyltransferase family A protein [Parasphingorhabdus marina]
MSDPRTAINQAGSGDAKTGIVIIGRNEGERLVRCLESLATSRAPIVYVDSASTDGSPEAARARGALVHDLDLDRPFTAARARNEGLEKLRQLTPDPEFVLFVDGDCEVEPGWMEAATRFLDDHPEVAAVCGRRRERYPDASVYNQLCDREWNTAIGEAAACGGDALMRGEALAITGGFFAGHDCRRRTRTMPQIARGRPENLAARRADDHP